MWVDFNVVFNGDDQEPEDYHGGVWVCDECQSPELKRESNICEVCDSNSIKAKRKEIAVTLNIFTLKDFVEVFNDALSMGVEDDQYMGLIALYTSTKRYFNEYEVAHMTLEEKAAYGERFLNAMDKLMVEINE